jgi:GT2 family glycosyltransferase
VAAPAVDVVLVNWNAGPQLAEALAALEQSTIAADLAAVVVDNASQDGSADEASLKTAAPGLALTILRNPVNRGFGAACNQGAASGQGRAVLFLNPDTRVAPDAIAQALRALDADPAIGIVGARLAGADGATHRTCARLPTLSSLLGQALALDRVGLVRPHFMREWDHEDTRRVGQVMGAFLLIRRSLLDELGGFDERFFVYYEDVDLCARAQAKGFSVLHLAQARAFHKGGGTSEQVKDRRLFYYLRSQVLYAAKHFGAAGGAVLLAALLLVQVPLRALHALAARSAADAAGVLRGAGLLVQDLPNILPRILPRLTARSRRPA